MSIGFATIFSLCVNVALAVFGAALVLLILWQGLRRRSNQYLALCMAIFALYGAVNGLSRIAQQANLKPQPLLNLAMTLYAVGLILMFNFLLSFAGVSRRLQWRERAISVPLGAVFLVAVWSGHVYSELTPLSSGGYRYALAPAGWAGVAMAMIYMIGIISLLWQQNNPRARELTVPVALLVVGVMAFSATPGLRSYSLNAGAMTVAVVMVGRIVLKYQVFQPLADLNAELDRKVNELYEATQAKSRFLANMSHELRTPLNSIIGYTELVTKGTYGSLGDLQNDRLQKVHRNGRVLLELINDVLDLSKIEAGRMILNIETVQTGELLDGLLDEFRPAADEKGLSLVRGYSQLPALCVDEARVQQILSNLISNAIKFTDTGAVIVRGHFNRQAKQVVLTVTDTGPGISHDRQDRLFDAYLDSESLLTRQREGTGLGLAIAHRLTAMHDGQMWFDSTPGQGTTFNVALPAAEEDTPDGCILEPKNRRGAVVLAIDDDYEALEVLQGNLETARFRVYGACNANDGLKLAHEIHPLLITLDVLMPGIDGWQMLESLRRDPLTANIPVLIISAMDNSEQARLAGADGFLRKPAPADKLLAEVRRLMTHPDHIPNSRQEAQA
jgi:signal transduction histidine kinase/ActR/RegA family two-component response regulator